MASYNKAVRLLRSKQMLWVLTDASNKNLDMFERDSFFVFNFIYFPCFHAVLIGVVRNYHGANFCLTGFRLKKQLDSNKTCFSF